MTKCLASALVFAMTVVLSSAGWAQSQTLPACSVTKDISPLTVLLQVGPQRCRGLFANTAP
jgi:hypothetical protein